MKVAFSTSVIQRGKTGVAQYVFQLLRAMDAVESDTTFTLFTLAEDREFFSGLGPRFEIVPVAEKYRPPVKNIIWHQTIFPGLLRAHQIDVAHIPSYRRLMGRAPCAKVGTIHDLAPFRVSKKYDLARMFYGQVVAKRLARSQDQIIAVSENTAQDIRKFFGIPQSRLRVIHNGIDHDRFFPREKSEAVRRIEGKYRLNKPFLLYVARLEHPGKNHIRLIEAFERFKAATHPDWTLAFGGSDWHGAEEIHKRIAMSPCADSIKALGFVPDEDLPWLYSAAECFIYPSLYEGFGLPPLEAMACGCPVISSDSGSLGEVIGNAALRIDPWNISDMQNAISRVRMEPELAEKMRRQGLERAAEFSWERCAVETLKIYDAALRGKFKRAGMEAPREAAFSGARK